MFKHDLSVQILCETSASYDGINILTGFLWSHLHSVHSCMHAQFCKSYRTHLFQAAHEIIADGRSRQVGSAWASPHIEEIIWAQHSVVLLSVPCGGQYTIHRYSHLLNDDNIERQQISNSFKDALFNLSDNIIVLFIMVCLVQICSYFGSLTANTLDHWSG